MVNKTAKTASLKTAKKTLIVFYSLEGSTKLMAQTIAKELDADLLECRPVKEAHPTGFMKYMWGGRQMMFNKEPKLVPFEKDPQHYDNIIIGTPVWAYTYAPVIRSFLAKTELKNKKVAIYCCHEGGPGKTLDNFKEKLSNNNTIIGEMGFLNVSKNKELNIIKAIEWSNLIKKEMKG
jgi:flavodoxin